MYIYIYIYRYILYSRLYHVLLRAYYEALTMRPNTTVSVFFVSSYYSVPQTLG